MGHKVLQDALGAVGDVHVTPVDPGVIRLESRVEQEVTGTTNSLATGTLGRKGVSLFHTHLSIGTKVLSDDRGAAEADFFIGVVLDAIELGSQVGQGVILAVSDEEGQIDQVVGVGQRVQELEILGEVRGGIAERGQDEDALAVEEGLGGRLDGVEIDFEDGGAVDFVGLVVVEKDGGLGVCIPLDHLVEGHFHWRFGGAVAVETEAIAAMISIENSREKRDPAEHTFASQTQTC